MNEEIHCLSNEGKKARNEYENDDSGFLRALYSVYKKLGQFLQYFTRYMHRSVVSHKYFKLISGI